MSEKYCYSCGEKMPEEYTYCPKCGKSQNPKTSSNKKLPLIIIGIVIAVVLVILCIILITDKSDEPSYSSSITFPQEDNESPTAKPAETTSKTTSKPLDEVKKIAPHGTFRDNSGNLEPLEQCESAYTNIENSASVFCISGVSEGNLSIIACAVVDNSLCQNGYQLKGNGNSLSAYFDIIIAEGGDYIELISANNPELFKNCEFTLDSFSEATYATYNLRIEFVFDGITYVFEGSASADYTLNESNQSGGFSNSASSDANVGNRMCNACYGQRTCSVCDGTGKTHNWDGNKVTCTSCHGTKICIACDGYGYY